MDALDRGRDAKHSRVLEAKGRAVGRVVLWVSVTLLVFAGVFFRAVMATDFGSDGTLVLGRSWWVGGLGLLLVVVAGSRVAPWVVGVCRGPRAVGLLSGAGLLLLALPLLGPLGHDISGALVGVRLPLGVTVQLVPVALLLLTLAAAVAISRWPDDDSDGLRRYVGIGLIAGAAVLLLARADDYGPALVLMAAVGLVALGGGRRTAPLLLITLLGGALGGMAGSRSGLVQRRLREWLLDGGNEATQVAWALAADAGWAGHGFAFGRANDIALADKDLSLLALVELGGLVSVVGFAAVWLVLLATGTRVATRLDDADRAAIATAIVALLAAKLAMALLMQSGVLPLSGLTTQLLSVGYSTLLVDVTALGILIGLSRPAPVLLGEAAQRLLSPQIATYFTLAATVASVLVLDLRNEDHLDPGVVSRRDVVAQQAQPPIRFADGQTLTGTRFLRTGRPYWTLEDGEALPVVGFLSPRARPRGLFQDPDQTRCRQPGWQTWQGDDGCDPIDTSVLLGLQSELMDTLRRTVDDQIAGATAVIVSPDGAVLAAGSSFDPTDVDSLLDSPNAGDYEPAAFSLTGPPGSTIKPLVGALADPHADTLNLPTTRSVTLSSGQQVAAWQADGCGGELHHALQLLSCNPTSIRAVQTLGYTSFLDRAEVIGYGRDISGPGVSVAVSRLPATTDDAPELAAIGQGSTQVTVAQQALLAATLAGAGRAPTHLSILADKPAPTIDALDTDTVERTTAAMVSCASSGNCGQALSDLDVPVAAKTGTAQQAGDAGNLGWCLAVAPADDPQIAAALRLDPTQTQHASGRQACDTLTPLLTAALHATP